MKVLDKAEKELYNNLIKSVKIKKQKIKLKKPPRGFEGW